jgi:hypothetical protein
MGRVFITASILSALAISTAAHVPLAAQEYYDDPAAAQAARLSPRELDSLLAPIALYPDQLLAPMLMAATYPHDVEAAADWTSTAVNASLDPDALAFALEPIEWDPSVKTLAQFPDVLRMLDDEWDWMVRVGNAFLLQETDVMDSIQRLRHQAYAAGQLRSTDMHRVRFDNGAIIIDMVQPGTVYIPRYDPIRVYGAWSYPDYPPYYFHRPVTVHRYFVVSSLWGWSSWDWNRHYIRIDRDRYRYFDRGHPWRYGDGRWSHDRRRGWNANYRRDGRDGRGDWRDNNRRGNDLNRNDRDGRPGGQWRGARDGNRNGQWDGRPDGNGDARRDGNGDGRPDGQWNGRRDGDRDGRERGRDGNGRRGEQRTDATPNANTLPPSGAFRGDPSENRRRFGENRGAEGRFRGRPPEQNAAPAPQAGEEQNRRRDRGEGARDRGRADRGPGEGRREFRGRQGQQAYAGPQLTPPAPVAAMPQEPRANREQRREFRAVEGRRGNPDEGRRQFRGNGGGENRVRPDGNPGGDRGGNREFRRGNGGGGNNGEGEGERRGRGNNNRGRD